MYNYQLLILLLTAVASDANYTNAIGSPCSRQDYYVDACLLRKSKSLYEYIKNGAPDLGFEKSEAVVLDEMAIRQIKGADVVLKNIHATGGVTITKFKSDLERHQFQLTLFGSHIRARGRFYSPTWWISTGGDCWGNCDGVAIVVNFRGEPYERCGRTYLELQYLDLDFTINDIRMGVENLDSKNFITKSIINGHLRTEAQNTVQKMKPELKRNVSRFVERILQRIPYDEWVGE